MEWLKVTVICLLVCVLKCSAMSLSEIEEFSNFLEKTAQLDEILKKGNPDDDYDDEEAVSDDAWEQSGKFEGDLILNDRQRRLIVQDVVEGLSRNGLRDSTKRWPDNEVIYYIQKEHFSGDQVQAIQNGIDDLAQASCIKFRPYRKGDRDAVVIQGSRRGCFSQVGYQGGYQVLNLSGRHPVGRGCFRHGTVVHELLHTLGFYHMQSSPDRDDYIDVVWENIVDPAKHNFRKYNTFSVTDFGVGYDYDSVLHYSRRAFSKNGQDTLVPKKGGASIGQRVGLSDKDTQKLNKMYCDADSDNASADEEAPQKSPTKKKKPKNKPFQGHGIGYHQGKTIVIKIAPAAQTYKLDDEPKFHVFDHFSKTPQAVSPAVTEGTGVGEEITYHHDPYNYNIEDYRKFSTRLIQDTDKEKKINQNEYPDKAVSVVTNDDNKNLNSENPKYTSQELAKNVESNNNKDINDAFDRLSRILKTHVYPSQTPDLEIYKTQSDYSGLYRPAIKYKPTPEVAQDEKVFGSTLVQADPVHKSKAVSNNARETDKNAVELFDEEGRYNPNYLSNQFDSSYGISYPLNKVPKLNLEKFKTPSYATLERLANKHDYSSYYKPREEGDAPNGKHTLFGYVVPVPNKWYNNDDIKKDNEKYNQDSYTSLAEGELRENVSAKLLQQIPAENQKRTLLGRDPSGQAYSIFGVLVPLTQKWYKVDYDPHTGSYLIEKPESSEDYR